jgi:hypothetical protein
VFGFTCLAVVRHNFWEDPRLPFDDLKTNLADMVSKDSNSIALRLRLVVVGAHRDEKTGDLQLPGWSLQLVSSHPLPVDISPEVRGILESGHTTSSSLGDTVVKRVTADQRAQLGDYYKSSSKSCVRALLFSNSTNCWFVDGSGRQHSDLAFLMSDVVIYGVWAGRTTFQ